MDIEQLNRSFALDGHASVIDYHGLPAVQVENTAATAVISFLGAHVCSYIPAGQKEMLYLSPKSLFEVGQPIRGGVPICWPWFSKNADDESLPMHGIGRLMLWNLDSIAAADAATTVVTMSLDDTPESRTLWNHKFHAVVTLKIGRKLELSIKTTNTGSEPFPLSQAVHTYYRIGDITKISIDGFDGKSCLNKAVGGSDFTQHGPIRISAEFDSVWHDVSGTAVLHDEAEDRTVVIEKTNSNTGVVWNPWIDKCKALVDFPDDAYLTFVCIEATNALEDTRICAPGETFELTNTFYLK